MYFKGARHPVGTIAFSLALQVLRPGIRHLAEGRGTSPGAVAVAAGVVSPVAVIAGVVARHANPSFDDGRVPSGRRPRCSTHGCDRTGHARIVVQSMHWRKSLMRFCLNAGEHSPTVADRHRISGSVQRDVKLPLKPFRCTGLQDIVHKYQNMIMADFNASKLFENIL